MSSEEVEVAAVVTEQSALTAALATVQRDLPTVGKSETATVRSDKGNYSYSYADLAAVTEAIVPLLAENGLAWVCRPTLRDGSFVLAYELRHESGESITGEYPLTGGTPQQIGSAITYARRYCLCSVTGVAPKSDDDDAQAARHHEVIPTRRRPGSHEGTSPQAPAEPPDEVAPTDLQVERFGGFRVQISGSNRTGLDALVPEIRAAYEAGEITGRQNRRLAKLWQERRAVLAAPASESAVPAEAAS